MASDTSRTASSWPTTRACRRSSIFSSFSRSPCIIFDTGMPVARLTTSAISSAPTWVRSSLLGCFCSLASASVAALSLPSRPGSLPYCSSATLSSLPSRCSLAISSLTFSISSLSAAVPCAAPFSAFQISSRSAYSFSRRAISCSISSRRFIDASSVSFLTASRSIFSWMVRRSSLSIDSGLESISILMRAAASSIRSIALSGRKRSVI